MTVRGLRGIRKLQVKGEIRSNYSPVGKSEITSEFTPLRVNYAADEMLSCTKYSLESSEMHL